MSKEDYVSLEVAKLLQDKGFEEVCHAFWWQHNTEERLETRPFSFTKGWLEARRNLYGNVWLAPTLYEVDKWLRNKGIFIEIIPRYSRKYEVVEYEYRIVTYFDLLEKQGKRVKSKDYYEKYEQCLNGAILEALKLI